MDDQSFGFDTLQLHAGQTPDPVTGARAVPIYQTTSFNFRDTQHAEDLFALREGGNIYTRIMNPTTAVLEARVAALEGGVGALAVASGSAAVTYAILNLAEAGGHVVAAGTLYGGTYSLLAHTLPRFGITTSFVDADDPAAFRAAIRDNTRALFVETLGNPGLNIPDFQALAAIAHEQGVPLVVDNTFATPYLFRPLAHGADIVVHSATKFLGGHGTSIGGVIVDGGRFDWAAAKRFPQFTRPAPGYHGMVFAEALGAQAYIARARVTLLRDTGACLSPFNAFLLLQGLETLSLRMQKHTANAERVAAYLAEHPQVEEVHYPGLPGNRYHELAQKYLPKGAGAILTFELKSARGDAAAIAASKQLIDRLRIFSHLANLGDARSLVIHPASTTHSQLSAEALRAAGVTPGQIRLSVGIEDVEDLLRDLSQAMDGIG